MRGASLVESDDDDFAPPTPHNIRLINSPPAHDTVHEPDTPSKRGRSSSTNTSILRQRMSKKSRVDQSAHHSKKIATPTTITNTTIGSTTRSVGTTKVAPIITNASTRTPPRAPQTSSGLAKQQTEQRAASQQTHASAEAARIIELDSASESEGAHEAAARRQDDLHTEGDAAAHSPILPPEVDDIWWPSNFGGASSQLGRYPHASVSPAAYRPSSPVGASRFTQDSIASSQGSHDGDWTQHHEEHAHEDDIKWSLSPTTHNPSASNPSPLDTIEKDSTMSATFSLPESSMATTALLVSPAQADLFCVASSDTEELASRSTTVINSCILCGKNLAHLTAARVEYHLNVCLDRQSPLQEHRQRPQASASPAAKQSTLASATDLESAADLTSQAQDGEGSVLDMDQYSSSQRVFAGANVDFLTVLTKCPICKSSWQQRAASSSAACGMAKVSGNPKAKRKVEHMKRCAKTHGQPIQTLLYQLRLLKEKHERAMALGLSMAEEEDRPHPLSQDTADVADPSVVDNNMSSVPREATPTVSTPQPYRDGRTPLSDDHSPLVDRRRERRQKLSASSSIPKPKPGMVRRSVVSMADTPDDNFMSDAIVTSVHIQQRQQAATNNSIARAERLVQMHEDQEDDGLQLALAMSLSEAESLGEPAILGVDGASSSTSVAANRGRKRRRRPAMEDHETSVLPVEEVKVLIQQKVLSLLFPEDEVNSSAAKNDSGAGMMVGALTPPWRPSRFRASHNQDDDCDDGGVSDPDSQVESFSQLCSDAKLPAPRMSHPSSSLWRLSQIGDPALKGGTNDMTGLQPAVTNLQALDQDIFVTRFMRQYILADRERIHAQAQAGGSDSTQADIHGDKDREARISSGIQACLDEMTASIQRAKQKALNKVLLLLASEQKQGSATKSAGSRLSRDLKSRSTKSEHRKKSTLSALSSHKPSSTPASQPLSVLSSDDEIVVSDIEDCPLSPTLRYSRPPSGPNALSPSVRRLSDRFSVTSLTTLPEIKSHQASNGISNDNAAPSFNFQGHDDDGDQYMSTDFLFSGSPQLEHSPVVSPVHSPEPMAAKVAPKRHSSEDVILLSSPPMLPSPSYPRRQPLLDYDEQPQDSSIIESNTSITSIRDESGDYCRLPPPLDLEQLLGFPLSQPAPRSAPMVEDHGLTPDHVRDHSIIDLSDPRRLSLIREEQEEDEEQRRRSLSSTLGLSRHARGRSRSEEPMGSASMVSTRMSRASPFLLPPPPPLSQNSQRRPNTLAGLPLLRHRAPASESHVITSASSPNPQPSSPSSVSRRALDPQDDVSTRPMSQQLPPSNSRSSRTFGRSASTTQLPSSMSTSLPSSSGEPAPSPGRSAPLTPSSRRGWRSNTGWGNGRFTRSGGVAPITAASRERAGTLVAESARVLATFVDGQEGSIASSQQSRVGVDNDDGRGAWRQQAGQGRAQDQQSTQDQQEPQMPDFEHMSVPRLRLAATSFGLRLGNKRKMVDELKAIWMRMNAPPPALSQTVAESAPQGAAVLSQGSTTLAKTNGGSSRQQPSSQVQDYNGAEEDRDDFMQEDSSLLGPDDRGMQSPFVERQNASRNPPVRADRTAGPSTRPSGSQTARGRTGSRSGRAAHNNDVVMEGGENGQDDFEQGQEGSENGNYDDDLEDDDDDEMEVFSPLDPDRMRMSMEDIILPASASQPQGSDDVGQGSSMSSSSFGRSGSASALGVLPADVDRRLYRFVASTPDLYRQCLLYKPIDLEELWERCQKADIQVSRQHLRLFLDRRGIVCFIPAHSPLSSWRKTRTKQATRGQQRGQQKQKQKQRQPRASKSSGTTARSRSSARGSRQRKRRGDDDDEEAQSQMMEDDDEDDEQPNPPASQPRPRPLARRPR